MTSTQALTLCPLPRVLMTRKPLADIIASEGQSGPPSARPSVRSASLRSGSAASSALASSFSPAPSCGALRGAGHHAVLRDRRYSLRGFVGLCYAELEVALLPVAGSTYTYTYATLGEIFAWIIGWDPHPRIRDGFSTVAVGWSGYIASAELLQFRHIYPGPIRRRAPGRRPMAGTDGTTVEGIVNISTGGSLSSSR